MEKNGAQKGLPAHRQADSEILTKILEEKRGKKPSFKASEARKQKPRCPKAGKALPLPSENNAFVEGKHMVWRGKTCVLMWENRRFAPLKRTFSHQKRLPAPCFPLPGQELFPAGELLSRALTTACPRQSRFSASSAAGWEVADGRRKNPRCCSPLRCHGSEALFAWRRRAGGFCFIPPPAPSP